MSRRPLIDTKLSDADFDAFLQFIRLRTTDIDAAHAWLVQRSYGFSRSTVGNYMKRRRELPAFPAAIKVGDTQEERRATIAEAASQLDEQAVWQLALYASFLLHLARSNDAGK